MSVPGKNAENISDDYGRYTSDVNIRNSKVACLLVIALMPAGVVLDYFVYRDYALYFLYLRIGCSLLTTFVFLGLRSEKFSPRQLQWLSMGWYVLPAFSISWMIAATDGATSPYYAGLNLVILAASSVIQATLRESIKAVTIIIMMYLAACFINTSNTSFYEWRYFVNNFYFITLTSIIVVTGNVFFNRLRFREFALRYELDQSKNQLEESNQKLIQLDQVKSRFFANISHELRTPLTLLLAPLENLIGRLQRSLDEQTRDMLFTMHSNGMRLLKLINDLLDLVRLDSGVMHLKRESVELSGFIKGLTSAARQVADDKRIQLEAYVADEIGSVMVDRDKFEKVILNLQFNALKFTPAGGRVSIRARKEGDKLIVSVEDTGMGISEKNLVHVFDRFWQADDSSKRKYQGVGIGLALVKELVEAHGGNVSVQSKEGMGTNFTISIPFIAAELNQITTSSSETKNSTESGEDSSSYQAGFTVSNQEWLANLYRRAELFPSLTPVQESIRSEEISKNGSGPAILIADDEPDMLRFLKSQLEEHYQVLEAVDGQQAVEKARQFLPDLILLDMMMPEKDGLQACQEIRESTSTHSIPIILLTARADEETKLAALGAGASDFLPKPFSTTELHVRIKNLVDSYQYQRKLSKQNILLESTIEQLKETELQLIQTEKLASLGRMSAGIIHEINNPLNFATTGLFALRKMDHVINQASKSEFSEILHDVEEGIGRVKSIVTDLRSFSHHENQHLDQVPLVDMVTTTLRFFSQEAKKNVNIEQEIDKDLCLLVNKNKMIQVLVNLIQNSLDALKRSKRELGIPTIRILGRREAKRNALIIWDNGEGIAPELMDKIFDPFFTTKDVGEGMGLGLSICYQIIQSFDGRFSVKSEPGKYCEFKLDFPI